MRLTKYVITDAEAKRLGIAPPRPKHVSKDWTWASGAWGKPMPKALHPGSANQSMNTLA